MLRWAPCAQGHSARQGVSWGFQSWLEVDGLEYNLQHGFQPHMILCPLLNPSVPNLLNDPTPGVPIRWSRNIFLEQIPRWTNSSGGLLLIFRQRSTYLFTSTCMKLPCAETFFTWLAQVQVQVFFPVKGLNFHGSSNSRGVTFPARSHASTRIRPRFADL